MQRLRNPSNATTLPNYISCLNDILGQTLNPGNMDILRFRNYSVLYGVLQLAMLGISPGQKATCRFAVGDVIIQDNKITAIGMSFLASFKVLLFGKLLGMWLEYCISANQIS